MKESSADLQKTNDALLAEIGERRSAQETLRDRTAKPYAVCGIATDITELKRAEEFERKRAQEKLAQLNRTLQTLYQCNQALVRATEESELLQSVCRILVDVGGFRMAWVGYREADEKKAVRSVASAGYDDGYPERVNTTWADAERGRGPTGTAIRTGTVSAIQDIMTDPGMAPWRAEALNRRYAFSVALPLMSQGEAFGALALYAEEPDAFTESTIERYTDLANNLSYAVIALRTREHNRVAAEEKLRKRSEQLQKHRDVLLGLAHSDKSDFPKAIRQICSVSAATLNVARVSYWSLQENGSAIACEVLYLHEPESFDEQCKGSRLGFSDCPAYFEALATKRPIVADRALEHSATCGLAEKYLKLHGISSLLHTPVWMRGEVVGVLCHEDRGPARHWLGEEIDFVSTLGATVSLALEESNRARSELLLRESEARLRESEERFSTAFRVSPLNMTILRVSDARFVEANDAFV